MQVCAKKGKGSRGFCTSETPYLVIPPICYPFYFQCSLMVSALSVFPSSLAIFPLRQMLLYIYFALCFLHYSHCMPGTARMTFSSPRAVVKPIMPHSPPYLPAKQCDLSTVWWRFLWTDRHEWYQTTSHAGSALLSRCHHSPLSPSVVHTH